MNMGMPQLQGATYFLALVSRSPDWASGSQQVSPQPAAGYLELGRTPPSCTLTPLCLPRSSGTSSYIPSEVHIFQQKTEALCS